MYKMIYFPSIYIAYELGKFIIIYRVIILFVIMVSKFIYRVYRQESAPVGGMTGNTFTSKKIGIITFLELSLYVCLCFLFKNY